VLSLQASHNPVGVGELAARVPRVAEYSNPGLEDGSPSGKMSKLLALLTEGGFALLLFAFAFY
jgi:hypothetical protein